MNTNSKRLLATVGAAVALICICYLLFRVSAAQRLRPVDALPAATPVDPHQQLGHETPATPPRPPPASTGKDAHDQFRRLNRCFSNRVALDVAKDRGDCSFYEGKPRFEKAYAECLAHAQDEANAMHAAQASMKGCPADEGTLINNYYAATKEAARAGNVDAQYCYLLSYFPDAQGHSQYTQKDIEDYQRDSVKYVKDAFERGDWRIVSLLSSRFIDPPRSLVAYLEGISQPETLYKMNRLLRMGATGDYAVSLDRELKLYRETTEPGTTYSVSKEDRAAADLWAQQTYEQHFQGQQLLTQEPRPSCSSTE